MHQWAPPVVDTGVPGAQFPREGGGPVFFQAAGLLHPETVGPRRGCSLWPWDALGKASLAFLLS